MAWKAGQHVYDRYLIERQIGEGGFGITYLARDPRGDLKVIKTLHDKVFNNPTRYPIERDKLLQNFRKETAILLECRHPNIVRVESFFEEDGLPCIVMEYIEGGTLRERMHQRGALSEMEALQYIQQVGDALTLVHCKKLLHRDINPNNIMQRADTAKAVLIDFGIAREFVRNMTQSHTALATPGYAPLEQYYDKAKRGEYTDVYALAATLYALLTGESPVSALDRQGELHEQRPDPLRPLIHVNPSVNVRVSDAVMWGMALDYKQRPKTVRQWLARLLGESSGDTTTLSPEILETTVLPDPQPVTLLSQTGWEHTSTTIHLNYVDQLAFSPDGRMLATHCGSSPESIKLWDVSSGKELYTARWLDLDKLAGGKLFDVHFIHSKSLVFSADSKAFTWKGFIWTLESNRVADVKVLRSPFERPWENIDVSLDLQIAVSTNAGISSDRDPAIKLWETSTGKETQTLYVGELQSPNPREGLSDIFYFDCIASEVRNFCVSQFIPNSKIFAGLL